MEQFVTLLIILNVISVIYLLVRYNQVKFFIEDTTVVIINEIVKQNNLNDNNISSIKIVNLIRLLKKLSFTKLLFSFKPLKLRYYFSREEILMLNRKVKK